MITNIATDRTLSEQEITECTDAIVDICKQTGETKLPNLVESEIDVPVSKTLQPTDKQASTQNDLPKTRQQIQSPPPSPSVNVPITRTGRTLRKPGHLKDDICT